MSAVRKPSATEFATFDAGSVATRMRASGFLPETSALVSFDYRNEGMTLELLIEVFEDREEILAGITVVFVVSDQTLPFDDRSEMFVFLRFDQEQVPYLARRCLMEHYLDEFVSPGRVSVAIFEDRQ